jgi:hypothetical protein
VEKESVMSFPITRAKAQVEDEPSVAEKSQSREFVKRWRGIAVFLRLHSHKVTRTVRSYEAKTEVFRVAIAGPGGDPPPLPPEDTQTEDKSWAIECGVMPPNDTGGPQ